MSTSNFPPDAASMARLLIAAAQRQDEAALIGLVNECLAPARGRLTESADRLLTEPAAARRLGISAKSLWTLAKRGQIAFVKIGTSKRYDPADLDRFVAASTVKTNDVKHALPARDVGP